MYETLVEFLTSPNTILFAPFILLVANSLGFPAPEDIVLVVAGFAAAKFDISFWTIFMICYGGLLTGDSALFSVGKYFGNWAIQSHFGRLMIKEATILKTQSKFARFGMWLVFFGRFIPGVRSAVFFSAGTLKYPYWKFLAVDAIAALITVPLLVRLGFWGFEEFGNNLDEVLGEVASTNKHVLIVIAVIAVLTLVYMWMKGGQSKKPEEEN